MKGKILLTAAGTLAVLGVAALLSRRTNERETFGPDGDRGDPQPVSDDISATLAVDEEK